VDQTKRLTKLRRRRKWSAAKQPPFSAPAFAGKAQDLQAMRDAVVDAASVGTGLWLSYLFVFFYLLIAVGGVTHRDLLFESPAKLPFLNVDLPLIGFFVLGPALFIIVHAYVLLHFVLLAGKVGIFHAELRAQIDDENIRDRLRRQLPSNIFVQFLAGPREVRTGVMGLILRLIAQISLVACPLALLAFFQLQFLPYHHEPILWWLRVAVIIDLALLWTLWPSIARGKTTSLALRDFRRGKVVAAALASFAPILLVCGIATFPGEWLDANLPSVRFVPTEWPGSRSEAKPNQTLGTAPTNGDGMTERTSNERLAENQRQVRSFAGLVASMGWRSLHELLVAGDVDFVARKPTSLWSNRLVLPGLDVIDRAKFDTEAKIAALTETLSLRGRRLEGAVLIEARLRKVDFTAARLQGASLDEADLRGARFACAGNKLDWERNGPITGFDVAKHCTQLQGAQLRWTRMEGAILDGAQLQGALLDFAQLLGASISNARLDGASLQQAKLQGATLDSSKLRVVDLFAAELQGASLAHAQLEGASLQSTQLQGAWLDDADLQDATLSGILAWRVNPLRAKMKGALVEAPETAPKYNGIRCQSSCDWTAESFAALKQLIEAQLPVGPQRESALGRIEILDPANPSERIKDSASAWAKAWAELEPLSPSSEALSNGVAAHWLVAGCDPHGAPYVIREFVRKVRSRFARDSRQPVLLASSFLDNANCPATRSLSQEDKVKLRRIRDRPPSAPTHAPMPKQ
jgi:uncharacterized protein YjbI with pentapeptide repeats